MSILEDLMDADLDTLATALYVRIDDTLKDRPDLAPWRPKVGIAPKLSDAELLTLAVMQALLGFAHEAAGCATPAPISPICSRICPVKRATTSVCAARRCSCKQSSACWPRTPTCGPTTP